MQDLYNISNRKAIGQWLESFCMKEKGGIDKPLAVLLKAALYKPLLNESSCFYLADAPSPRLMFIPDPTLHKKIEIIRDWIKIALAENFLWLKKTDAKGLPQKLLNFSTFDQALHEARKNAGHFPAIFNRLAEAQNHIKLIHTYEDGLQLMRILTLEECWREGKKMSTCMQKRKNGLGGEYDEYFTPGHENYGAHHLYSLRTPDGASLVIFDVECDWGMPVYLSQCRQKANALVDRRYLPHILDMMALLHLEISEQSHNPSGLSFIKQNKQYIHFNDIGEGFIYDRSLRLGDNIDSLPNFTTVQGTLTIGSKKFNILPDGLHVEKTLFLLAGSIDKIPDDLRCGSIQFYDAKITNEELVSICFQEEDEANEFLKYFKATPVNQRAKLYKTYYESLKYIESFPAPALNAV